MSSFWRNGKPNSSINSIGQMGAHRIIGVTLLGAFLALPLSGCSQKKTNECKALITVINSGVQALEKTPPVESDATGVKTLRAMADAMDKVADEASKVPLSVPELKKMSADYQKMVRDISNAEREMAKAAEERDLTQRAAAEEKLTTAVKQEEPLVEKINGFCRAE